MTERWLPVIGFEGLYSVSSEGRVMGHRRNLLMAIQHDKDGYACLLLKPAIGKQVGRRVSRIMLEAFIGPAPPDALALHNDGDLTHNILDNLRWGSALDNANDKVRHGRQPVGERASRSKLTAEQVRAIRDAPRGQASMIARSFGVSKGAASLVRCGRNWSHIPGAPGAVECRGEDHPNAKLTAEIAASIRADTRFQKAIAADYGVHQVTVSKIKRGLLWAEAA